MKRALAERAKQSGLPNGMAPTPQRSENLLSAGTKSPTPALSVSSGVKPKMEPSSGPPSSPKPSHTTQKTITNASRNGPSSLTPTSSPRPKKRLRESAVKMEEEDEDDANASAFFLRHQNRALASELRQLHYQLSRITRERDFRRSECTKAVQSLNALQATWTQMEAALQHGQPPPALPSGGDNSKPPHSPPSTAPLSTGSGTSVELIGALLDSLATLGTTTPGNVRRRDAQGEDDSSTSEMETRDEDQNASEHPMDAEDQQQIDDLLRITDNIANRANTLQRWIWSLLHRLEGTSSTTSQADDHLRSKEQIVLLKAKNKTLKAQLKEVARSRDEFSLSDRRVRRGLYRLAAGRIELKEVLKAIVTSDEDKEAAAAWMEVTPTPVISVAPASSATIKEEGEKDEKGAASSAEVAQLKKQIADLELVASTRDEQIKKLYGEKEEQAKKINSLVLKADSSGTDAPTDSEVKRSDVYTELVAKLSTTERKVQDLEEKEKRIKEEWSNALATSEEAQKALEDLRAKHSKQWAEVSAEQPAMEAEDQSSSTKSKVEGMTILQHKLTQALENVRSAEDTRKTLHEAISMNESLQAKLEEVKSKYAALQQGRASAGNNQASSSNPTSSSGVTTPKPKSSSSSGPTPSSEKPERSEKPEKSAEKLHRDYRRIQKQLAAATASKEAAKAKLERTEKERDALNSTNSRLLKQAAEKDEMNAKSLSTILHLKQMADQITKEKETLEQQAKSANQVALTARLAANAGERLTEEIEKERKNNVARVKEWEDQCQVLSKEKELLESKLSQQKEKMSSLLKDVDVAKGRSEELASESTKHQEEKQQMMESLVVAQKEAMEAAKLSDRLSKQSGSGMVSGFTAEQLSTHVSVLKSRLACPVCNARDKKCILLRCRHMFCKQCVDENIKNRSRKCPACGGRFDTKDVADVWL